MYGKKEFVKIGDKFGKLVAIEDSKMVGKRNSVLCQCDCGSKPKYYRVSNFKHKKISNCGCLHPRHQKGTWAKDGIKKCGKCLDNKTVDNFTYSVKTRDKLHHECIECARWYILLKRRGVTKEQYQKMVLAQDGRCYICKEKIDKLLVDHNHSTMETRKLLCHFCNTGLGYFYESIELLEAAKKYLLKNE